MLTVAPMTTVEHMHQHAAPQEQEGQPAEKMSAMFCQKEEQRDRRKTSEYPGRDLAALAAA
jgi:hypothetical protein